ncbi:hypothetical protein ABTY59_31925 [Streptomyces sp. NPDC096079]|uniref:hypothetical protein n=1 Tax=Streptomyces sp. NPDC096079 TaxID=3155820 RepID=UPI0033251DB0
MSALVTVPVVPDGADVHASKRWIVTGVGDGTGEQAVHGPEVGHGASVDVPPGVLLLVVDESITGWGETYYGGKRYPLMDAAVSLHLVLEDGGLKVLWTRHFKTAKGAFGAAGLGQIRKHLAAHPPVEDLDVVVVDPGPGRPNFKAGSCRWCGGSLAVGAGVLVGRGPDAEVEHRQRCPARHAEPGTACGLCSVSVAPGTATTVMVREDAGRWEVRHTLPCEGQVSYEEYVRQAAENRAADAAQRAQAKAEEEKRAKKREAAAAKRKAAAAEQGRLEKAAAEETQRRVETLDVVETLSRTTPFDKGLDPTGTRMRLDAVTVRLSDGELACWWEVSVYGGRGREDEVDERGGRFFRLPDARAEYQRYRYEAAPPRARAWRWSPARAGRTTPCPADDVRHCDHCGIAEPEGGGWMAASVGLACGVDCYTEMSNEQGAHARQYHRS